MTNTFEREILY